jgi:hypothetical protein
MLLLVDSDKPPLLARLGNLVKSKDRHKNLWRLTHTPKNHPFREIGVGIMARPDSRETTSRLSRLFLFRRGTPPQNRSDSRGDFGVPGTRSRNDIAAIRLLRPARSGGRVLGQLGRSGSAHMTATPNALRLSDCARRWRTPKQAAPGF